MEEYKLDYKKMFDEMKTNLDRIMQEDNEYFELLRETHQNSYYVNLITKNLMNLKKIDQIKILRITKAHCELCKSLCEKYGFEVQE